MVSGHCANEIAMFIEMVEESSLLVPVPEDVEDIGPLFLRRRVCDFPAK